MNIEIKPETIDRIKKLDRDITDVDINRFLDILTSPLQPPPPQPNPNANAILLFENEDPSGSSIYKVVIEGREFSKDKRHWKDIVAYLLGLAGQRGYTLQQIEDKFPTLRVSGSNKAAVNGWDYVKPAKLSVHNTGAKIAIPVIRALRDEMKISVDVQFTLKGTDDKRFI